MAIHLHRDLEKIKKEILILGSMVEEATSKAVLALKDRRADLAKEVVDGDKIIDEREIRLEEDCLKLLALHQPVAHDLRFVIAVLKVNNDLERVGDLAGNLASRVIYLCDHEAVVTPDQLLDLANQVPPMLHKALDALIRLDTGMAREVLLEDEEIDAAHEAIYGLIEGRLREDPAHTTQWIHLLSVSRYLERIADLATNIAEDVVFLVDGDVVRHQRWN